MEIRAGDKLRLTGLPLAGTFLVLLGRSRGQVGAVAQLGERLVRNEEVRGSIPLSSMVKAQKLPLGVTGNTPDSGSGESWFEPRRGNAHGE